MTDTATRRLTGLDAEEQALLDELASLRRRRGVLLTQIATARALDSEREARIRDLQVGLSLLQAAAERARDVTAPSVVIAPNGTGPSGDPSESASGADPLGAPGPRPAALDQIRYWGGDKRSHLPAEWDRDHHRLPAWPRSIVLRWRLRRRRT